MKEQLEKIWKLIYHNRPARKFRQFVRVYPKFFLTFTFLLLPVTGGVLSTSLKIHVVSPDHMEEQIKCSVLDFIQATQLRKNAIRQEKAGKLKSTVVSWVTCIQNNPCNLNNIRDFLSSVLRLDKDNEFGQESIHFATWLLKVGDTDLKDVPLVCDIYLKYGSSSQAENLLIAHQKSLPQRYKAIFLKLLYSARKINHFESFYTDNLSESDKLLPQIVLLKTLLHYEDSASRTDVNSIIQTIQSYEFELEEKELLDLLFTAANSKGDIDLMDLILKVYDKAAIHSYLEHNAFWIALIEKGEIQKVKSQLENYDAEIRSAEEFKSHHQLLINLGEFEDSEKLLPDGLNKFGFSMDVWISVLLDLESRGQWPELRKYAEQMITDDRVLQFHAIPKFYAGLACVNQGMFKLAEDHIKSINGRELLNTPFPVKIVKEITNMGFTEKSQTLMESLIKSGQFDDSKILWSSYLHATHKNLDLNNALFAARKVYELHPNSFQAKFNYAGLLLLKEEKPTEALYRAKEFFDKDPNWAPGSINYAHALILNGKFEEALRILTLKINPIGLTNDLKSEYHLARFKICHHFQQKSEAREFYNGIDKSGLFPIQRERIESLYESLK